MTGSDGQHGEQTTPDVAAGVAPGSLSALLSELARLPPADLGAWDPWLKPGAVIGRFELVREIGRGGLGVVYEARDRELGRSVAFKAVRAGGTAALREERLLREAETAARLSHPNIATLHDVGRTEHGPYLVLELLRGQTLEERLGQGRVPVREALRIGVEIAKGVGHAHAQGVVHRDLKPSNVFLCEDGQVKVLDFGLAHAFGQRRADGGTPSSMAPEQWKGAPEDERTDVFALGVMLYRMLAGELPFPEDGGKAVRSVWKAPTLEVPDEPALGQLVGRMLEKDPTRRPRDGGVVLSALSAFEKEVERSATPSSAPVRARHRPRMRLAGLLVTGAVAGAGLALGVVVFRERSPPAPTVPAAERVVVAVADFANETRDPDLDGLSGLLITSLEQSRRLQVLTRSRMLDLLRALGKERVERIDEGLAREVGAKAGARALIFASVRRFDELYTIEAKGFDPGGNSYLFTAREDAQGKSAIPAALDRLSERTRQALHESAAEIRASEVKIAEAVTPSLEAHRHYFRGLDCVDRSPVMDPGCPPIFERAVTADPGFALAWLELASARWWSFAPSARDAMRQALDHLDRSPPRERLQIRALAAQMEGREDEAAALFRLAVEASPGDRPLVQKAADFFLTTNDFAAAIPYLRRWAALDASGESQARYYLAWALGVLGRRDELHELASELEYLPPRHAVLLALAMARFGLGERAEAVRVARQAKAAALRENLVPSDPGPILYGELEKEGAERAVQALVPMELPRGDPVLLATQGRQREALVALDSAIRGLRTNWGGQDRWIFHNTRANLLTGDGLPGPVWEEAQLVVKDEPVLGASLAVQLAYLGDLPHAAELGKRLWPGSMRFETWRAVVLWRTGERRAALEKLRALSAKNPGSSDPPVLPPSLLLGELAAEMGEDAEAVEALRRFQSIDSRACRSWAYPRSLYLVARSLERLGRRDEARAEIEHLLRLWKKADPDLPLLAEAKALRKRLASLPAPAGQRAAAARGKAPVPSIAVLPFADMSAGKDQEYLADGIAEEVLSALSRVEGLRVPGRVSSFYFKGRSDDLRAIGERLKVASVLEGSVRRSGERIRVTAELVNVADGYRVWSETYERALGDVFAVEDDIARAVVAGLRVRLLPAARPVATAARTASPEAYAEFLKGKYFHRRNTERDARLAIAAYERAIALDPGYAPAWAWLSLAQGGFPNVAGSMDHHEEVAWYAKARASAERAIALAPDLPGGYVARAGQLYGLDFDWAGARADVERALALARGDPVARHIQSQLLATLGKLEEAIAITQGLLRDDPLFTNASWMLAVYYNALGRFPLAREVLAQALEVAPEHARALRQLAYTEILEGRPRVALEISRRCTVGWDRDVVEALAHHDLGRKVESDVALARIRANDTLAYQMAQVHAWRGEADEAFEWLERSRVQHDPGLVSVKYDPFLRKMRSDPRYAALLRKMNLPVE